MMNAEKPCKMSHAQKCDDMQRALLDTVIQAWDAFKLHNNNFGPDDNSEDFCDGVELVEDGLNKLMEE